MLTRGGSPTAHSSSTTNRAPHAVLRRAPLRGPPAGGAVEAMLFPIDARGQEGSPLPLTGVDVFLGRDASLVGIVLDDPSVEGMHARMIRLAGGGDLLRR